MTVPPPLFVKIVGITGVQMMKNRPQIGPRSFQQQMVMIRHQAEAMHSCTISFCRGLKIANEPFKISPALGNRSPFIPPWGNVVKSTRKWNPKRPSHKILLQQQKLTPVKSVDLTPNFFPFFCRGLKIANEPFKISLALENRPPFIPPWGNVVKSTRKWNPKRPSHKLYSLA